MHGSREMGKKNRTDKKKLEEKTRQIAISRVLRVFSDRQTDRQTDRPTDRVAYRVACTRLKRIYAIRMFHINTSKAGFAEKKLL